MTARSARSRAHVILFFAAGLATTLVVCPTVRRVARAIDWHCGERPIPLMPSLWKSRVGQFQTLDARTVRLSLIYVGHSVSAWVNLEEYLRLEDGRVLNRAIPVGTTRGVLRRVRTTFPKVGGTCFLLVGYNDLSREQSPKKVAGNILAMRDYLLDDRGVRCVVVESLLSVATAAGPKIPQVNDSLLQASRDGASFLDLYPSFLVDGCPDCGLYADPVHLSAHGILHCIQLGLAHLKGVCPELSERVTAVGPGSN